MSLPQSEIIVSVEEYLALERESEERHEFLDGQIYEMAGENLRHGAICTNLTRIVSTQLLNYQSHCDRRGVVAKHRGVRSRRQVAALSNLAAHADSLCHGFSESTTDRALRS